MTKLIVRLKGGSGSGNFGHEGRPGEQGGSAPDNNSPKQTRHPLERQPSETVRVTTSDAEFADVPRDIKNFALHAQDDGWQMVKHPSDSGGQFRLIKHNLSQQPVVMKYTPGTVLSWMVTARLWSDKNQRATTEQHKYTTQDEALRVAKKYVRHL